MIVLARNNSTHGLTPEDVQYCLGRSNGTRNPVLYLCGKGSPTSEYPTISFANWPIPIAKLAAFINGLK